MAIVVAANVTAAAHVLDGPYGSAAQDKSKPFAQVPAHLVFVVMSSPNFAAELGLGLRPARNRAVLSSIAITQVMFDF